MEWNFEVKEKAVFLSHLPYSVFSLLLIQLFLRKAICHLACDWIFLLRFFFLLNVLNVCRNQNQLKWQLRSNLSLQLSPSQTALLWVVWKEENCISESTKTESKAARVVFTFSTIFFRLSWCQWPVVPNGSGKETQDVETCTYRAHWSPCCWHRSNC